MASWLSMTWVWRVFLWLHFVLNQPLCRLVDWGIPYSGSQFL